MIVLHKLLSFVSAAVSEFVIVVPHGQLGILIHLSLPFCLRRSCRRVNITTIYWAFISLVLFLVSSIKLYGSSLLVYLNSASVRHLTIVIDDKVHKVVQFLLYNIVSLGFLQFFRIISLTLLLLLRVKLVEMCPNYFGVWWHFWHIFAFLGVCLPFLKIKLWTG